MTYLEQIIRQQVAMTTTATVSEATRQFAQELVQELMRDQAFVQDLKIGIRKAFTQILYDLHAEVPDPDNNH